MDKKINGRMQYGCIRLWRRFQVGVLQEGAPSSARLLPVGHATDLLSFGGKTIHATILRKNLKIVDKITSSGNPGLD